MAQLPQDKEEKIDDIVLGSFPKMEMEIETYEDEWELSFDGSFTLIGGGIGWFNKKAEYEAMITRVLRALNEKKKNWKNSDKKIFEASCTTN